VVIIPKKKVLCFFLDLTRQAYFGKLSSTSMSLLQTYLKTDQANGLADIQESRTENK
jgi:hypothetical protein